MDLLKVADVPPTTVSPDATVAQAVDAMVRNRVGAVAIVSEGILEGIFSERDIMRRIIQPKLDPGATKMSEVMTTEVAVIPRDTNALDALSLMIERHIRHLPITDEDGRILGMLSIRNLLQRRLEDLSHELEGMETYLTADGAGG